MSTTFSHKILVVGPTKSGKTALANFLSEHSTKAPSKTYSPTIGTRILEFEKGVKMPNGDSRNYQFEMWDSSGSLDYQSSWPALQADTLGLIIVFHPARMESSDLLEWYQSFAQPLGLTDRQIWLLAHDPMSRGNGELGEVPPQLARSQRTASTLGSSDSENVDADTTALMSAWNVFLAQVVASGTEKREKLEREVLSA